MLGLAGDWSWPEGWIFGGWFLAVCVSTTAWLYRNDPALLAERYRALGTGGQSRRNMNPACESNTEPPGKPAPSDSIDSSVATSASRRSTPWQWWSTKG